EIVAAVRERLAPGTVVDGEIVRWTDDGRLDFGALQRRHVAGRRRRAEYARTEPCHYVVFDVLESRGVDLRPQPLRERRTVLEALLGTAAPSSRVIVIPQTSDVAEAELWFDVLAAQGVEGLVVKDAGGPYLEGRRRWRKVKRRITT